MEDTCSVAMGTAVLRAFLGEEWTPPESLLVHSTSPGGSRERDNKWKFEQISQFLESEGYQNMGFVGASQVSVRGHTLWS